MKRPVMSKLQRICMPSFYDGMEKSGKKYGPREVFRRNPYRYTESEVENVRSIQNQH